MNQKIKEETDQEIEVMAAERWMLQTKKADVYKIAEREHISPVKARIIRNRDVRGVEDLEEHLL